MANLPKYWVVENDHSQQYKDTVIKYLNDHFGATWNGNSYKYYGYDGSKAYGGSDCHESIEYFDNSPVVLSLRTFLSIIEEANSGKIDINPLIINVPKI